MPLAAFEELNRRQARPANGCSPTRATRPRAACGRRIRASPRRATSRFLLGSARSRAGRGCGRARRRSLGSRELGFPVNPRSGRSTISTAFRLLRARWRRSGTRSATTSTAWSSRSTISASATRWVSLACAALGHRLQVPARGEDHDPRTSWSISAGPAVRRRSRCSSRCSSAAPRLDGDVAQRRRRRAQGRSPEGHGDRAPRRRRDPRGRRAGAGEAAAVTRPLEVPHPMPGLREAVGPRRGRGEPSLRQCRLPGSHVAAPRCTGQAARGHGHRRAGRGAGAPVRRGRPPGRRRRRLRAPLSSTWFHWSASAIGRRSCSSAPSRSRRSNRSGACSSASASTMSARPRRRHSPGASRISKRIHDRRDEAAAHCHRRCRADDRAEHRPVVRHRPEPPPRRAPRDAGVNLTGEPGSAAVEAGRRFVRRPHVRAHRFARAAHARRGRRPRSRRAAARSPTSVSKKTSYVVVGREPGIEARQGRAARRGRSLDEAGFEQCCNRAATTSGAATAPANRP